MKREILHDIAQSVFDCINVSEDADLLRKISSAAKDRIEGIQRERHRKACDEAWEWAKTLEPGQTIYCAAPGTFLGGPLQRGDKAKVICIQPRAKRLWFRVGRSKKQYWCEPSGIVRYAFQEEKPEKSVDQYDRALAGTVGRALDQVRSNEEKSK